MSQPLTDASVLAWAQSQVNGKIVEFARQSGRQTGGRPAWFLTAEGGIGEKQRYYIRGDRGGDKGRSLQREAALLQLLKSEGIPVPGIVAASRDPGAVLMEFVEGADDFTLIQDPAERDAVTRDFARVMAQWHAIPAQKFGEIGLPVPADRQAMMTRDLDVWQKIHSFSLKEPVPLVNFACKWLRDNIPEMPERLVLVQGDTGPGQFLFKDRRIQAILDFEFATVGDPMRDLAHIRTRDAFYPTGNLPAWLKYYSEFSGLPLDLDKIRYYSVMSMLITALGLGPVVERLDPGDEHTEWLAENVWSKRATMEALAEALGIELEPVVLPQSDPSYLSQLFHVLEKNLREEQLPNIPEGLQQHRLRLDLRLLTHMRNVAEIGREMAELELEDMKAILGRRPGSVKEGHRAMNQLVMDAGPDLDRDLTRYFYRHARREEALMRGALGRVENAVTAALQ